MTNVRRGLLWTLPALLAVLLSLSAPAQAHASPDPLDVEVQLLADDTDDAYAFYDGYDLQDLYVREAYLRQTGESGLVFRMIVYGGFAPAPAAQELHLDVAMTAGGSERTFRISSGDGANWTGDALVVESSFQAAEPAGLEGSVQVFVPYSDLGMGVNGTVSDFRWLSYADGDLRDVAPGGRPVPGTGGEAEIPGESRVTTESIALAGPVGYTETRIEGEGYNVTLAVQNRISVTGQHILVDVPTDAPGWQVEAVDLDARSVEPGEHPAFTLRAQADPGAAPLEIVVTTDLGGRETVTLEPAAAPQPGDGTGGTPAEEDGEESPGLPLVLAIGTLAMLAWTVQRRAR